MRGAVRCAGWCVWLCLALIVCGRAIAQTFDATNAGTPAADLSSATWRIAMGDDPDGKLGWADPAFDDSRWKTITLTKPFEQQGYPSPRGFFWMRLHLRMTPGAARQAILLHQGSYRIFFNGRLLAQEGGMPDHPAAYHSVDQVYPIPADAAWGGAGQDGEAVIAIRLWFWARSGISGTHLRLGNVTPLENDRISRRDNQIFGVAADDIVSLIALLIGLWAFALFRAQPDHREYLWLGAMSLIDVAQASRDIATALLSLPVQLTYGATRFLQTLWLVCFIFFICSFLRLRVNWAIRLYCAAILPFQLVMIAWYFGQASDPFLLTGWFVLSTPTSLFAPLLALRQWRRGDREAGLLVIALSGLGIANYAGLAGYVLFFLLHSRATYASLIPDFRLGVFPVSADTVASLIFTLMVGAIMLRRSLTITRQQQRTAAELEAARSVQTFLLGRKASAPGYTVESAYLPAQEVGGDFFQTTAGPNGSLLAVIGDVAGKGLQAAMRVSMLIGVVRTSPEYSPAALLHKLNGVLLQDGSSGFTTCLVARLDADGTVTIANAGHLSPYINGREMAIDGGLPLGVMAGVDYSEQTFPFVLGDTMLLLSDGVVEARNATRELFGFERMARTAAGVTGPASLAETARAFGQDDDITVLTIARLAESVRIDDLAVGTVAGYAREHAEQSV